MSSELGRENNPFLALRICLDGLHLWWVKATALPGDRFTVGFKYLVELWRHYCRDHADEFRALWMRARLAADEVEMPIKEVEKTLRGAMNTFEAMLRWDEILRPVDEWYGSRELSDEDEKCMGADGEGGRPISTFPDEDALNYQLALVQNSIWPALDGLELWGGVYARLKAAKSSGNPSSDAGHGKVGKHGRKRVQSPLVKRKRGRPERSEAEKKRDLKLYLDYRVSGQTKEEFLLSRFPEKEFLEMWTRLETGRKDHRDAKKEHL